MKKTTLIYCNDGNYGKALAKTIRGPENVVGLRNASVFIGNPEPCDAVIVMDDVAKLYRDRIAAFYPGKFKDMRPEPAKLEVGVNSYVSVKQAEQYLAAAAIAQEVIQRKRRGRPRKVSI